MKEGTGKVGVDQSCQSEDFYRHTERGENAIPLIFYLGQQNVLTLL